MNHFKQYVESFSGVEGFFGIESTAVWDSLLDFQAKRGLSGSILEIGVYYGRSAALLALHATPDEELVLIDFSDFLDAGAKLVRSIKSKRLRSLKVKSSDPESLKLGSTEPGSYRWIHVDGDHKGQSVINDFKLANALLADDGIICLDVYMSPMYPQLTSSVCEYLAAHRFELQMFLCGFNKAYIARPKAAPYYLEFVRKNLADELESRGVSNFTIFKTDYNSPTNCFGISNKLQEFRYYGLDDDPAVIPY